MFQSMGVSRTLFIISKWLQPKNLMFALNGDGCATLRIVFSNVSISLSKMDAVSPR